MMPARIRLVYEVKQMIEKEHILLVYLRYQYNKDPKSLIEDFEEAIKRYGSEIFQDVINSLKPYWTK